MTIMNDENEDPAERERARERLTEKRQKISNLENERYAIEKKLPLRERVKNIFKRYGFTVTAILLPVGLIIGVIVDSVAKGVGNGQKNTGKKYLKFFLVKLVQFFLLFLELQDL